MEVIYLLMIVSFLLLWRHRAARRNRRKASRLATLIVNDGQIVEKFYVSANGKGFAIKGKWKI